MTDDNSEGGKSTTDTQTNEGRNVTVSRVIEAPPDRVYNAFLDPDDLATWLPPTGFSAEVHKLEPEEGGSFRITFMAESDELEPYSHSFGGTYLELKPGEKIVHTDEFETDDPGMAGEMTVTITFEEVADGTELTVVQEGIPENIPVDDAEAGWTDSLENLTRLVS
ncbi:SRPBCC domain-containing protein [Halegenticoccus tardaugens]|uniref:SRPBCC domain-containing protein n=1 Tax=Halegenticoccus tardaugens TaxID=2071624 RepID=UPI00100AA512|nr:SRPBCC domain-containing protein [Halegenticoccus tardaugens]